MENSNVYAFGFNNPDFSDLVLKMRFIPDIGPSDQTSDSSDLIAVREIYVDSLILASKSEMLRDILANRVRRLRHEPIEITLKPSDESVFLDLLRYIYCMDLQNTRITDFMALLGLANQYLVPSCVAYCCRRISLMYMDSQTALNCLILASQPFVSESDLGYLIKDSAKTQLITCFKDVQRMRREILDLPLIGLEVLLETELLIVDSEDELLRVVLEWGSQRPEQTQDVVSRLFPLIRIPFLSLSLINELISNDLSAEMCFRVISFFRDSFDPVVDSPDIGQRCYRIPPIRVVELGYPHYQTSVLLDLKWSFLKNVSMAGEKFTRSFIFNDQVFLLSVTCKLDGRKHVMGFYLWKQSSGPVKFDCELSIRVAPTWKFKVRHEAHCQFSGAEADDDNVQYCCGIKDMAGVPWSSLVEDKGPFCCNGHLCLKADLLLSM